MLQWSAVLAIAAFFAGGQAEAVPVQCQVPCNFGIGSVEQITPNVPLGSFTDNYYFHALSNVLAVTTVSINFPNGVQDLKLEWVGLGSQVYSGPTGAPTAFYSGQSFGDLAHLFNVSLASGGDYILRVTGIATLNNYYTLRVEGLFDARNTGLPLPPALLLFGSALVGLTVLGRRKRQGAAV